MAANNLLVIFLLFLILLTAVDPAMAAGKKKKSKTDIEVGKQLDPIVQELEPLSQKGAARGLFSPEEAGKTMEIKLKLLDLIQDYPTSQLLIKPSYEVGRLLRAREMYDDAYDFFNYIQTNFPTNPYAIKAKVEIQRMKQLLGDQYFAESAAPTAGTPAVAKP